MRTAVAWLALASAIGCTPWNAPERAYEHSRYDYWAFRSRIGLLPEPNYLPFAMHLEVLPDGARALVACRWPQSAFPLRYIVAAPEIPPGVIDEFNPTDAQEYVAAVDQAFERWEQAIGFPVAFRRVESGSEADVHVSIHAEPHPEASVRVLGLVEGEHTQCRVTAAGETLDEVEIEFAAKRMKLYVVDPVGLLTPNQVFKVALHEVGHILGSSGQHSPLSGDVMYRVADDSRIELLSEHDVNSFRALYRVPPGSIYARIDEVHRTPMPQVRQTPPRLAPVSVDTHNGFTVQFPVGWQVVRSPRGFTANDGVTWDNDASIDVISLRGSMQEFYDRERYGLEIRGTFVEAGTGEIDGRPYSRLVAQQRERRVELRVMDWIDGWVLVTISDAPARDYSLYRMWFEQVLLSIDAVPREPLSRRGAASR